MDLSGNAVGSALVVGLYLEALAAAVAAAVRAAGALCIADEVQVGFGRVGSSQDAACAGIDQIGSGAFRSDLAAMRHETMDVRIFKT